MARLSNVSGQGGCDFRYSTNITTTDFKTYFQKALENWACNSGHAFSINTEFTSTTGSFAGDGVNTVAWDTDNILGSTTLAAIYIWTTNCNSSRSNMKATISEQDFVFNDSKSWYYGTGTPSASQYDFYSVALHEVGHAAGLGHVINSGKMIHYSISAGATARTFNSAIEVAGGAKVTTLSTASQRCSGYPVMNSFTCTTQSVSLASNQTSISENASTATITVSIPSRYYKDITVNLAFSGTATHGTDYTCNSSITIPAGYTSYTTTLISVSDALYEGSGETLTIDISSVTNATENGTQQKSITINDNDAVPTVSLSRNNATITESGATPTSTITATPSAASGVTSTIPLTVTGTATSGSDYILSSSTITIAAGSTTGTATVTVSDDTNYKGSETKSYKIVKQ